MIKKIFNICMLALLFSISNFAQLSPQLDWFKCYDGIGNGNDFVNDIKFDKDFNCFLAGRSAGSDGSQDLLIIKYSSFGELLTEIRYISAPASWEEANSISIDTEQNIYAVGRASFGNSTFVAIIHKYSKYGNLVWEKNYSNLLNIVSEGIISTLDSEDNLIAGVIRSGANILKLSPNGDSLWCVNINDSSSFYTINNLITDASSNIYLTYSREYYDGGDVPGKEIILLKLSKVGQIEWSKTVDLQSSRKLLLDRDSNLVVSSLDDAKIVKYSLSGELLWEYDPNGLLTDIATDSNNNIIMCGYNSGIGVLDYMTQKISCDGVKIWENYFNSIEDLRDVALSTVIDENNNIYVAGHASDMFTEGISYILKYDTNGSLLWQFRYDIEHSKFEHPQAMFLDDSNNVIIAGEYTDSTNGSNFFAMKLKQMLGAGIQESNDNLPLQYFLSQNYPNPFNPNTQIEFAIPKSGIVKLEIYDVLGRKVKELINQYLSTGSYKSDFEASDLSSGIYYFRLSTREFIQMKKAVLLK